MHGGIFTFSLLFRYILFGGDVCGRKDFFKTRDAYPFQENDASYRDTFIAVGKEFMTQLALWLKFDSYDLLYDQGGQFTSGVFYLTGSCGDDCLRLAFTADLGIGSKTIDELHIDCYQAPLPDRVPVGIFLNTESLVEKISDLLPRETATLYSMSVGSGQRVLLTHAEQVALSKMTREEQVAFYNTKLRIAKY